MYDEKESEIGCMSVIFRGASIICSKLKKKKTKIVQFVWLHNRKW